MNKTSKAAERIPTRRMSVARGPVWRTADGQEISIKHMTDTHLANAILFLERAHARYRDEVEAHPPMFQGEMAQYYAEREWLSALENDDPADLYPIYNDLVQEQALREDERARYREKHPWPPPLGSLRRKVR